MEAHARVTRLAVVWLTVCAGACTMGPRYHRPEVPLPAAWRTPAETSQSIGNLTWWDLLKDPELQGLVRAALASNTDVRLAANRVVQAQAQLGIVRANQLPEISGTAGTGRERVARSGSFGVSPGAVPDGSTAATASAITTASLGVSASYAIDFWGRYRRATEQARATLLATREAQTNVVIGVISTVAQQYFQLRALDAQLEVTNRTVSALQESQRLTTVLFQGGVASELDVQQAQSAVQIAQANVPALQRSIAQQENAISALAGRIPGDVGRGAAVADQVLPPDVPSGLPSALLERRPDIRAAEQQLAAAFAGVGVAQAQFLPAITLTGSGGLQSTTLTSLISGPTAVWALLGNLATPLFQGGRLRSNLALARAQQEAALITYQGTILDALRDVSDALVAYQRTREELTVRQALVTTEQRALELSTLRYRSGIATFLEVLDTERELFSAELSVAQTQGSVLVALVQLYEALGGGWGVPDPAGPH
jgi:outer membrane protein, multidrug efflux system